MTNSGFIGVEPGVALDVDIVPHLAVRASGTFGNVAWSRTTTAQTLQLADGAWPKTPDSEGSYDTVEVSGPSASFGVVLSF